MVTVDLLELKLLWVEVKKQIYHCFFCRAVAPDLKTNLDTAERRKRLIEKSKYLGGDMEHTHLVKGLDYALLEKIRSEAERKAHEKEQELEEETKIKEETINDIPVTKFRTIMGKNVFQIVASMGSKKIERNELFIPGNFFFIFYEPLNGRGYI